MCQTESRVKRELVAVAFGLYLAVAVDVLAAVFLAAAVPAAVEVVAGGSKGLDFLLLPLAFELANAFEVAAAAAALAFELAVAFEVVLEHAAAFASALPLVLPAALVLELPAAAAEVAANTVVVAAAAATGQGFAAIVEETAVAADSNNIASFDHMLVDSAFAQIHCRLERSIEASALMLDRSAGQEVGIVMSNQRFVAYSAWAMNNSKQD
ncbi:unnamed protein product [Rhodiola kirilowii]